MREAHVRAKAAERQVRQEQVRFRELEARYLRLEEEISAAMAAGLNEPDRVEGCSKVRFHQQSEAGDWRTRLAALSGEAVDVFDVYRCRDCPLSPVTMRRYWHVGHPGSGKAQASKAAASGRRGAERAKARRDGRLLEQRVNPQVIAQLRQIAGGETRP